MCVHFPESDGIVLSEKSCSLFEFADEAEVAQFAPINDVVMGGMSSSGLLATADSTATFSGLVSLENSGGFASIRAPLNCLDLSAFEGIRLRILGDGKRYKLRLTNSPAFDTTVHEASFSSTDNSWDEVNLPFSVFEPKWRGRLVASAAEFDKERVCGLGLMISEKQAGEFLLRLDWIRAYA